MPPISSDEAYRQAGVDLKSAEVVVDIAKKATASNQKPWMLGGIGGFSGAFEIPEGYKHPVLLSACDGVGTKLKLAFESGIHDTVGIDLVAMSVNDILVNGGKPLVFLDYVATDKIKPDVLAGILKGISAGCEQSDCALAGGETAELPGFYQNGEYDLAGFAVGVVEKAKMLPKLNQIEAGDVLIGLPSSGLHSNGFSLVRKILFPEGQTWSDQHLALSMAPTRIYVEEVLALLKAFPEAIPAMAHITGGGFYDNIPRILPEGVSANINANTWQWPEIFEILKQQGNLSLETMCHTFNCGMGMVLVVKKESAQGVLAWLQQNVSHYQAALIGELIETPREKRVQIQGVQVT
jgi:phosphoribosylformylglycinamidine cyclo-ligase